MSMIQVSPSTRLYSDCDGHGPGKTLGQLTDERFFVVVKHKPGHAKPYLIAGKYNLLIIQIISKYFIKTYIIE